MARNEIEWWDQEIANYAGMEAWEEAQDEWIELHPPHTCGCDECRRAYDTLAQLEADGWVVWRNVGWWPVTPRQREANKAVGEVFKAAMARGEW